MARRKNKNSFTPVTPVPALVRPAPPPPLYTPVSSALTPYGTKAYRTPTRANQFTGTQGSPQEALVLDIDGTMQGWGGGLDDTLATWCAKHYKRNPDIVFLIVTARDHEHMYETSFNWSMREFPYSFIGPFCRALDDPRLASEFKRQLAVGFEELGVYKIVGAADDNAFVIKMWQHWKATRHAEFDLLECDAYGSYGGWRSGLPSKGGAWGSYTSFTTPTPTTASVSTPAPAKNRPAGQAHYPGLVTKPVTPPVPPVLPSRAELEDIACASNPALTPAELDRLEEVDLRELAGISNGDYREMLYAHIAVLFGSRCCEDELDAFSLAEVEDMLEMTREQIETRLDARFEAERLVGLASFSLTGTDVVSPEEHQRRQQRLDLEDLACRLDPELSLLQAEQLDSQDLLDRVAVIEAQAAPAAIGKGGLSNG